MGLFKNGIIESVIQLVKKLVNIRIVALLKTQTKSKQLKRRGFKEVISMNIYRSLTLSQYLYNAFLLEYLDQRILKQKKIWKNNNTNFYKIGITYAKALEVKKIEPFATFLDNQCVHVVKRILRDSTHPIPQKKTVKSHHNKVSS
jgi:hypothetical protein